MLRPLFRALVVLVFSAGPAGATSVPFLSFDCVKSSNSCSTLGAQLTVDLVSGGAGKASFVLQNHGGQQVTGQQIFFDDNAGVLKQLLDVTDGPGTDFAIGGKPDNLKGGKKIGFLADFFASAAKPAKDNGLNAGDTIKVNFLLNQGVTIDQVLAALDSGSLRLGINAKKSYVTQGGTVPEPGALLLLGLAGAALAWKRKS